MKMPCMMDGQLSNTGAIAERADYLDQIAADHPTPQGADRIRVSADNLRQMLVDCGCCPCCGNYLNPKFAACECGAIIRSNGGDHR